MNGCTSVPIDPVKKSGLPQLLVVLPASVMGGAETSTLELLRGISTFRTSLLTQASIASFFSGGNWTIQHFEDYGCHEPYLLSPGNILRYGQTVREVIKKLRPQVVLGIMHNGTVFVAAAILGMTGVVGVGTILGHFTAYYKSIGRGPTWLEKKLIWLCFRQLSGIITPSQGVCDDLVDNYNARREKTKAIHNGIDLSMVRRRAGGALQLSKVCPWVVTACRLGKEKDFGTLLRAFARIRKALNAKLIVVGEGEQRAEIEMLVTNLDIAPDVILTGFMENPFPFIAHADVFVLSSFFEGFGNVIIEAMALGIPVVASDCPTGPGEIIENGISGFLVPVGDDALMAERCLALLNEPKLHRGLSNGALSRVKKFSAENMVENYQDFLLARLPREA